MEREIDQCVKYQRDMAQPEAQCKCSFAIPTKSFLIGENYMRVSNLFRGWTQKSMVENYSSSYHEWTMQI